MENAKDKERIKQRQFAIKTTNRNQTMAHFGVWDEGSEKLETSLAPSVTQCPRLVLQRARNLKSGLKEDEKPRIKTITETISTGQEKFSVAINSPFRVHAITIQ